MGSVTARRFLVVGFATVLITLAGCPIGKIPGRGGGGSRVDPNTCGSYAVSDAGRKFKAFLEATVRLDVEATHVVEVLAESCRIMGRELQIPASLLEGDAKAVCDRVTAQLNDDLKAGFKAKANLDVVAKPAVCTVDARAMANAAAECEGKVASDMDVTCTGTCEGVCDGTCRGSSGAGQCNGQCDGICRGQCTGTADVKASAQCEASAEVNASLDIQCTEPELAVKAEAGVMIDTVRAERAMRAIRNGLPKILSVRARLKPLDHAVKTWVRSALELAGAGDDLARSFQGQSLCISGQLAAVASATGRIATNISVSVSISASVSGSAGVR
jgi:hypothetical protein